MPKPEGRPPINDPYADQRKPEAPEQPDMDLDEAYDVEMPFGKYAGHTLGEIVDKEREGLSYIWWLKNEAQIRSDKLDRAINCVYHHHSDECDDAQGAR